VEDIQTKPVLLENALKALARIIKAANFYPPGHPALKSQLQEGINTWQILVRPGNLVFSVKRDHFILDNDPVGKEAPMIPALATAFFGRRVQRLLVMPDLCERDLLGLGRALSMKPEVIQQRGGLEELLLQARITSIWFNELDLDRINKRRQEIKDAIALEQERSDAQWDEPLLEESGTSTQSPSQEQSGLEELLRSLQTDLSDERYALTVQELIPQIRQFLTEEGRILVIEAFALLLNHCRSKQNSAARRNTAENALKELGMDDILDFLVSSLCLPQMTRHEQETVIGILLYYGNTVIGRIMDRLSVEKGGHARRCLTDVLSRQESAAVPVLAAYLKDDRWYVVRNAVFILGEIRHPSAIPHLEPLLGHNDVRVGREAIRALARIGGPQALDILLDVAEDEDPDLRRLAFLSLGAMKEPAAVPFLLHVLQTSDPLVKNLDEKKDAIRALGEIASADSWPHLIEVLRKRKLWKRSRYDELRVTAASALANFNHPEVIRALEEATNDRSEPVARAAVQSLKPLRKG